MRVFKRLMRSSFMAACIGWLIAAYMVLVKYTTRWDVEHADRAKPVIESGEGLIALTWHSRFLMLNSAWKKSYALPYVLISRSRDGAIVAFTTKFLGLKSIRGSTKKLGSGKAKGGAQAGRGIIDAINQGGCIVITPDGPRGPRQRLGMGPLRLAKMTGVPILPCTFSVARRKQFDSWDKFVLPKLFGKGKIIWGTPVTVSKDANEIEMEALRLSVETEMNTLLAQADMALGHTVVEPA
jgi:lysophospholipid acyltransferase (LPLAT)-like uncharacterized protein